MFNIRNTLLFLASMLPLPALAQSVEIPDSVKDCAGCHQLQQSNDQAGYSAPPLFFAGNKYRQQWLEDWLQEPYRLRPSGGFYADHVVTKDGVDSIDESSLNSHPALDNETAIEVSEWLMSLTPMDDLLADSNDYSPGSVSPRLGAMDFVKFKGCGGCHRDTPEYGGLSGPELYTAWNRLQPHYIVSYIKNPRAWNKNSAMPNRALNDGQIHKLANYLKILTDED